MNKNTGTHHLFLRIIRWTGCASMLVLSFFSIPGLVPAQSFPQWKGTITKEGDVTVVHNPKEPMFKGAAFSLKEDLTIPTTGANDRYMISDVRQVIIDDEGRIYVLDSKSADIKVFDALGRFLRTIGRQGQGPGEINLPMQISINRTKKEICVLQSSRRVSFFGLDGNFLRHVSTSTIWGLAGRVDSMGNLVLTEGIFAPPEMWYALKKFDPNMKLIVELARTPAPKVTAFDPFLPIARWTLDDQDNIIYGYPKTYEILVFGAQNKLVRKIQKEYNPIKVSDAEIEEAKKDLPAGITPAFSNFHSAFRNLLVDEEGRIYVQTWRKDANGQCVFYDLFDKEGRYLAVLNLKERAMIRKGKMYSVDEDEDGYQTIKRYAVTWNLK